MTRLVPRGLRTRLVIALVGIGKRDISYDVGLPVPLAVQDASGRRGVQGAFEVTGLNDQHAYLRLPAGHRLRTPVALTLAFLALIELSTLSRSGLLGLAVGLLILAVPYRRRLLSARFLVPLAALFALVAIVVSRRADFFQTVLRARTEVGGSSTRVHLEIYELLAPVIDQHPAFGLGLNTFSQYYEFVTGRDNFGPHSYYVALLTETGLIGAVVFLVYLVYLAHRLRLLRSIGRELAARGDSAAARVRPLAWGLTAALVGTLVANAFYLTMQMYYFFVLALLIVAAPLVFGRNRGG